VSRKAADDVIARHMPSFCAVDLHLQLLGPLQVLAQELLLFLGWCPAVTFPVSCYLCFCHHYQTMSCCGGGGDTTSTQPSVAVTNKAPDAAKPKGATGELMMKLLLLGDSGRSSTLITPAKW
jgi:hypothetical protein